MNDAVLVQYLLQTTSKKANYAREGNFQARSLRKVFFLFFFIIQIKGNRTTRKKYFSVFVEGNIFGHAIFKSVKNVLPLRQEPEMFSVKQN